MVQEVERKRSGYSRGGRHLESGLTLCPLVSGILGISAAPSSVSSVFQLYPSHKGSPVRVEQQNSFLGSSGHNFVICLIPTQRSVAERRFS